MLDGERDPRSRFICLIHAFKTARLRTRLHAPAWTENEGVSSRENPYVFIVADDLTTMDDSLFR